MPGLTALAVPAGSRFVDLITETWERGDAFAPIDTRLPRGPRQELLSVLKPTEIVYLDDDGVERRSSCHDGEPVVQGDALVIATSGTSGEPKAVIHTHESIWASANASSKALAVDPATDKWLACLPVAHIGGLSVILRSLVTNTPVEVHERFDAAQTRAAASNGVTLVSLVTRALQQVPPELFRTVLIGGAAPPDDLADNVIPTYGMTETGSGVIYGNDILDGCELQLLDDNGQAIEALGETGGIAVRGPMLFRGYRGRPSPFVDGGWFATGDLGHWSNAGALVVEGRYGDVIVTGGEKVWPAPIEHLLATRPDIAEVALVGRPDRDWGHRIVALLLPTDPAKVPSLAALKQTLDGHFPSWCSPKEIEVLDAPLPRTSLGKLRRTAIG